MRPDLEGLSITKGELRHLSGINVDQVFKPPTLKKFISEGVTTMFATMLIGFSGWILVLGFPEQAPILIALHIGIAGGLITSDVKNIDFAKNHQNFINLIDEVEKYNTVIKAMDISDQIEDAGNPEARVRDREKVIEALHLTRQDLIRALKTERILRTHKNFLNRNANLFANNLNALTALQVSDQAGEHGRLLNEALQIAVSTQTELKKLQDGH